MTAVESLVAKIQAMRPGDRLRLAAALIDHGKPETAEPIIGTVYRELQARRLLGAAKGTGR